MRFARRLALSRSRCIGDGLRLVQRLAGHAARLDSLGDLFQLRRVEDEIRHRRAGHRKPRLRRRHLHGESIPVCSATVEIRARRRGAVHQRGAIDRHLIQAFQLGVQRPGERVSGVLLNDLVQPGDVIVCLGDPGLERGDFLHQCRHALGRIPGQVRATRVVLQGLGESFHLLGPVEPRTGRRSGKTTFLRGDQRHVFRVEQCGLLVTVLTKSSFPFRGQPIRSKLATDLFQAVARQFQLRGTAMFFVEFVGALRKRVQRLRNASQARDARMQKLTKVALRTGNPFAAVPQAPFIKREPLLEFVPR